MYAIRSYYGLDFEAQAAPGFGNVQLRLVTELAGKVNLVSVPGGHGDVAGHVDHAHGSVRRQVTSFVDGLAGQRRGGRQQCQ